MRNPGKKLVPQQLHSVAGRYQQRDGFRMQGRTPRRPWFILSGSSEAASLPQAVAHDERLARLEAILVMAREPLSTRKLSQYANLADATEARTLVRRLNERYDQVGRAFRVEEVAGGYQLLTRPKFATWLRRLEQIPRETRLSGPTLETLAVVAYRQPAGRAEIEAIRGVNCGEILRQLLERDLVRHAGRSDELGRPYLYATTKRFLQLFGLRSLDELPRATELKKEISRPFTNRPTSGNGNVTDSPERSEEESQVTATIRSELAPEELTKLRAGNRSLVAPQASDEEGEDIEDDDETGDDDEDEFEDFDDDDDDDEEFDEVEDDELEDEDLEDEEWEEVEDDDEEEEWEEEDDEEEEWDDDEEDDEEEEEEEEDWE